MRRSPAERRLLAALDEPAWLEITDGPYPMRAHVDHGQLVVEVRDGHGWRPGTEHAEALAAQLLAVRYLINRGRSAGLGMSS